MSDTLVLEKTKNAKKISEENQTITANIDFVDGRSLRKTKRTHPLSTKIQQDTYKKLRLLSFEENVSMAEILEKSLDLYLESSKKSK